MKNLIICAHFDDEVLGCSSILKNSDVLVVCGNDVRKEIANKISNELGIKYYTFDYEPHSLQFEFQNVLCDRINEIARNYENIYTHNANDYHKDHQIVSNCVDVITRKNRTDYKSLIHFFIETDFKYNYIKEVDYNFKVEMINKYKDYISQYLKDLHISKMNHLSVENYTVNMCEQFKIIYMKNFI